MRKGSRLGVGGQKSSAACNLRSQMFHRLSRFFKLHLARIIVRMRIFEPWRANLPDRNFVHFVDGLLGLMMRFHPSCLLLLCVLLVLPACSRNLDVEDFAEGEQKLGEQKKETASKGELPDGSAGVDTPPLEDLVNLDEVTLEAGGSNKPYLKETPYTAPDGSELTLLIEPLDPVPSLEELDQKVEWEKRLVVDIMELHRKRLAKEAAALQEEGIETSPQIALDLKNNSDLNNLKINAGLGVLPESDSEVDYGATLTRHFGGDVKSTNPLFASAAVEFELLELLNTGTSIFDEDFNLYGNPEMIVSWESSKDRMYDKFVLRDDLTWSDGQPLTAHDVAFSYKILMTKEVPIVAQRTSVQQLRWVHAYDDRTFVVFHQEPLAINKWNTSFSLLPKHKYEMSYGADPTLTNSNHHIELESNPVTSGPYKLEKRKRGEEVVVTRREDWYQRDGKPVPNRTKSYFKTISFKVIEDTSTKLLALKSGDLDEAILTPEQWTDQTDDESFYERNTKARGLEWVYFYFGWNIGTPYFEDVRVRQAMSYAFDYEEFLKVTCYGLYEQSNGIFHETSWMAHRPALPLYERDLEKAEALLDAAGWELRDELGALRGKFITDENGKQELRKFEFTILCANSELSKKTCELLKQNLKDIGVICNVLPTEFTVLMQRVRDHQFDASFGGWGTGAYPDTSENIWGTDEARNYVQYSNPKVDKLFQLARKELDEAKRAHYFAHIQRIIYEEQPYTFLFFRNSFHGFNKRLRGWRFSPRGPFGYSPGIGSVWTPAQ